MQGQPGTTFLAGSAAAPQMGYVTEPVTTLGAPMTYGAPQTATQMLPPTITTAEP